MRTTRLLLTALLALLAVSCREEVTPAATETIDAREPVGFWYVGAPELQVREKPDDTSAVIAAYQSGEGVSVLAEQGEWVEIRAGAGSGWAKKADLTTAEAKEQAEDNPQPRFLVMPAPIPAPGVTGEVYIEADVNTDGDVTGWRVISNTTGRDDLAQANGAALRLARFHPIVQKGERKPFKYYHRVTY